MYHNGKREKGKEKFLKFGKKFTSNANRLLNNLSYKPGGLYQSNDRDSVSSIGAWVKDNAFFLL